MVLENRCDEIDVNLGQDSADLVIKEGGIAHHVPVEGVEEVSLKVIGMDLKNMLIVKQKGRED